MSHFSVMVIGNNPEAQLQPYHEYECTGIDDQYVVDVDKDEEVAAWLNSEIFVGLDKFGKIDWQTSHEAATAELSAFTKMPRHEHFANQGLSIDLEVKEWFGFKRKDGKWFQRTNPNSKWDWYVLGGRWSGVLRLKKNPLGAIFVGPWEKGKESVDQAFKGAIDFEGMRKSAWNKAHLRYKELAEKLGGKIPTLDLKWEDVLAKEDMTIQQKRELYHAQPAIVALHEHEQEFFTNLEDFQCSADEYAARMAARAITTYAIVKDSKWYAKGEMGRFGMSSDSVTQHQWNEETQKMLDSLPDSTLISIYDCHI